MATWPHEFVVNTQDNLPACILRHHEDIRSLGPGGAFYSNEDRAGLRFGAAIDELERDFAGEAQEVRLSDLLSRCCKVMDVAFSALPVTNAESLQLRARAHAEQAKNAKKAKAKAAPAPSDESEDDGVALT